MKISQLMSRRALIKTISVGTLLGGALTARSANAQTASLIEGDILSGEFLLNPESFVRYRNLSTSMTSIRQAFNGPFGYENAEWAVGAQRAWRQAFYLDVDLVTAISVARDEFDKFASSGSLDWFSGELNARIAKNYSTYENWLGSIGVDFNGKLAKDLLSAQAAFAMLFSAQTPEIQADRDLSFFDQFTWIWPICGG